MFKYISEILKQFTRAQKTLALLMLLFSITIITIAPSLISALTVDCKDLKEENARNSSRIQILENQVDTLNAKIRRERNDCGDNAYQREKEFYAMLEDLRKDAKKYEESSSNKMLRMVVRRPASDTTESPVTEIRNETSIKYPKMSDKIKDIQNKLNLKH
jgi:hypothetical protein